MQVNRDNDPCQNCGGFRFMHVDLDKWTNGVTISASLYDEFMAAVQEKYVLYGNSCLNFKLDNLKWLENIYDKR